MFFLHLGGFSKISWRTPLNISPNRIKINTTKESIYQNLFDCNKIRFAMFLTFSAGAALAAATLMRPGLPIDDGFLSSAIALYTYPNIKPRFVLKP